MPPIFIHIQAKPGSLKEIMDIFFDTVNKSKEKTKTKTARVHLSVPYDFLRLSVAFSPKPTSSLWGCLHYFNINTFFELMSIYERRTAKNITDAHLPNITDTGEEVSNTDINAAMQPSLQICYFLRLSDSSTHPPCSSASKWHGILHLHFTCTYCKLKLHYRYVCTSPIRHNIMTTCLILCFSPFCCQNSPDSLKHGLH